MISYNNSKIVMQCGEFAYKLDFDWAKWPKDLVGSAVVSGCCDDDDNLYVSIRNKKTPIVLFNKEGSFIRTIGTDIFGRVHGLYVTKQKTILCADDIYHVVRELSCDGKILRTFGNFGVPCDNGYDYNIFTNLKIRGELPVDTPYNAILECNEGLKTIKRAGGPFGKPTRMVQGSTGKFYCSDGYANAAVHRFSADGLLEKTWGWPGSKPGQFKLPHGIWVDKLERVWVADRENSRIQVFDTNGCLLKCQEGLVYRPSDIWSDSYFIYVGETDGALTIFNMEMEIVSQIGFFESPLVIHGICGNSNSDLFIQTLNERKRSNLARLIRE